LSIAEPGFLIALALPWAGSKSANPENEQKARAPEGALATLRVMGQGN
jgi:hypothetical protein